MGEGVGRMGGYILIKKRLLCVFEVSVKRIVAHI